MEILTFHGAPIIPDEDRCQECVTDPKTGVCTKCGEKWIRMTRDEYRQMMAGLFGDE